MKKMFRLFLLISFVVAVTPFAACSDPDPDPGSEKIPEETPTAPVNEFRFGDKSTPIRSLVVNDQVIHNMYTIILSPDAGLTTYEEATAKDQRVYKHPFIRLGISAASAASFTVDMLHPNGKTFMFENNSREATEIGTIVPGSTGRLKAGEMSVTSDGKKMTVRFKLTLSDGRIFDGHYEGNFTLPEKPIDPKPDPDKPEIYYEYNGNITEVKSMIVDFTIKAGEAYILMSPSEGLSSFAEFSVQDNKGMYIHEFCFFVLPNADLTHVQIDVKNPGTKIFSFINQLSVFDVGQVTDLMTTLVSEGSMSSEIKDGVLTFDAAFVSLLSGGKIVFHGKCPCQLPV